MKSKQTFYILIAVMNAILVTAICIKEFYNPYQNIEGKWLQTFVDKSYRNSIGTINYESGKIIFKGNSFRRDTSVIDSIFVEHYGSWRSFSAFFIEENRSLYHFYIGYSNALPTSNFDQPGIGHLTFNDLRDGMFYKASGNYKIQKPDAKMNSFIMFKITKEFADRINAKVPENIEEEKDFVIKFMHFREKNELK